MDKSTPKKAFIFDLDGVLINDEPLWEKAKKEMFTDLFGREIYSKIGSTIGSNISIIHKTAIKLGSTVSYEELFAAFEKYAFTIYNDTPITQGVRELGNLLIKYNYAMGIVSASPRDWMQLVIDRLSFKNNISVIISIDERKDLEHKPSPAGYNEAIKRLKSIPSTTIILEDSNAGITSAKATGAYVVGLRQNLVDGYTQQGADIYVDRVEDIEEIIEKSNKKQ